MNLTWVKKNWLSILLCIVGFLYTFSILSSHFDGDLGWELRFGHDVVTGHFPYTDTYTWTYQGLPWVNHEWGASIIWWLIFHFLGYNALVIFVSLIVWGVYIAIPRAVKFPISPLGLLASLAGVAATRPLLFARPAIAAILFFLLEWYALERIPQKKYFFLLPPIIWLWSLFHGSWILGFIVIGIYAIGNIATAIINKKIKKLFSSSWDKATYGWIALSSFTAAILITINPYGFGIWREIVTYFTQTYYYSYINEWLPSYAFPLLWLQLILGGVNIALGIVALVHRKITIPQFLLLMAFIYTGNQHKRNMTYAMFIAVPLWTGYLLHITEVIKNLPLSKTWKNYLASTGWCAIIFCLTWAVSSTFQTALWHTDVWSEKKFLTERTFPYAATMVLKDIVAKNPSTKLFNAFRWGGFLNWMVPETQVFLDGRGTVSWSLHPPKSLFQEYREIQYLPGGLAKLEAEGVTAIFLEQHTSGLFGASWSDRLLFTSNDLAPALHPEVSELEKSLNTSARWKKVYSDFQATIWIRTP